MIATVITIFLLCFVLPITATIAMLMRCSEEDYQWINQFYPKITFELFIQMYSIRPEKWTLGEDYVWYDMGEKIAFKTRKDHRKYRKFYTQKEEQERQLKILTTETKLAKHFQKDVSDYRSEVIEEMKAHMPKEDT